MATIIIYYTKCEILILGDGVVGSFFWEYKMVLGDGGRGSFSGV